MPYSTLPFVCATVAVLAQQPKSDPIIDAARQSAAVYQQSLPDYIVKRTTTRYRGARSDIGFPATTVAIWRPIDVVKGDVAAEHGHEIYSNITLNGTPSVALPTGGAWSAGEFSTELAAIFPIERGTRFTHQREESLRSRPSYRYEFAVDQAHSAWHLSAAHLRNMPAGYTATVTAAYGGEIWIDKDSGQVLRIEMSARTLPPGFPLDAIESDVDYDFVRIGDAQYVLPVHSESYTCERGVGTCLRNETVYRDYDKFGASTNITFDGPSK